MTQPLVIDYLRTHSLQQLEDDHGVVARQSSDGSKLSLNYDQILVKNGDLVAEQCRGMVIRPRTLITDLKDQIVGVCDVVAWPMNRFYNLGDASGAEVHWGDSQLCVYEKLDGTMIVVYWDDVQQRWHAATRAVPEADLPIRKDHIEIGDMTFSGLFDRAFIETYMNSLNAHGEIGPSPDDLFSAMDRTVTYVFELTSQWNRVVVKYDAPRVTLLAARHLPTGKEIDINVDVDMLYIPRPKMWRISDPTAIIAFVNQADPAALEGAVVCDSHFRRLKVKNKAWVLSSRAKDLVTVSRRSALEAIIVGSIDDVIPLVEADIAAELMSMQNSLRNYLKKIDKNFIAWKQLASGDRKTFAQLVQASEDLVSPYFQILDGKGANATAWITEAQATGRLSPKLLDAILEKMKGCQPSPVTGEP